MKAELGTSMHSALRSVLRELPRARAVSDAAPLERMPVDAERPSLVDASCIESGMMRAHVVGAGTHSAFVGFLDGTQRSEHGGQLGRAPIVVGRVAAAIRERVDRKLRTWRAPVTHTRVYVPFEYVDQRDRDRLAAFSDDAVRDTSKPDADGVVPPPHPTLLLERARFAVSRDRESAERTLAEQWCASEHRPLFIDGGVGGSPIVASAECAVGVIKSHRTLYVDGAGLDVVLALRKGERTSVFAVAPRARAKVYSWYLRLRDPIGHDALWGIVRVEMAETERAAERADEISRWVLAETAPNAMPDTRWDKMAYGIRNAEEFLRAL